jgi:TPR repeat protein
VKSAHKLALIYEYPTQSNNLIPIDVVAAFEWFKAAAQKGHVTSMAELALCYELGCGVTQSDEEALDWYTKAANAGHSASHYSVGEHFEEARGVRMDHEEACLWYYRAAVLGEEDGVDGLRRLVEVARRVVPQVDEVLHA